MTLGLHAIADRELRRDVREALVGRRPWSAARSPATKNVSSTRVLGFVVEARRRRSDRASRAGERGLAEHADAEVVERRVRRVLLHREVQNCGDSTNGASVFTASCS